MRGDNLVLQLFIIFECHRIKSEKLIFMSRHIKISIIVFLITLLAVGCEEDNFENNPVSFDFQLLNEQGNPSTNFNQGKNFYFRFLIKNNAQVLQ